MPKIPIQNEIYEVSPLDFQGFLKMWVKGVRDFNIQLITSHAAGLADFKGIYCPMMFNQILRQSKVIEPEIETAEVVLLFQELLRLTGKIRKIEQEMIAEYARVLDVDLSIESNRKKLDRIVYDYRFGDTIRGANSVVPESVTKIGSRSVEWLPSVEKIAADLTAAIDKTPVK